MDLLHPDNSAKREEIVAPLEQACSMEMEPVMSYTANCPRQQGVHGVAGLAPAARRRDRHRPRDQGRDRGRARRDRALHTLLEACAGADPVTEDMVITILADEQDHVRTFEGFLRDYEAGA